MILPQIFTLFNELTNDPEKETWPDVVAEIYFQDAYHKLFNKLKNAHRDYAILRKRLNVGTDFTAEPDSVGNEYSFILRKTMVEVIRVEAPLSGNSNFSPLSFITINDKDMFYSAQTQHVYFEGDKLVITNVRSIGEDIILYFVRPWSDLQSGITPAIAPASNQLRLADTPTIGNTRREDDYYIGAYVRMTGVVGNVAGQERRIIDYVAYPNPIITVDRDWDVNPALSDTYSLIPEFPENHHALLAYMMAMIAMIRRGNTGQYKLLKEEYTEKKDDFLSFIKVRQDQQTRPVNDVSDGDFP